MASELIKDELLFVLWQSAQKGKKYHSERSIVSLLKLPPSIISILVEELAHAGMLRKKIEEDVSNWEKISRQARMLSNEQQYILTGKALDILDEEFSDDATHLAGLKAGRITLGQNLHEQLIVTAPASDRIVKFSDNQPQITEIDENLNKIETAISSNSNELGFALGDDRDTAVAEIGALRKLLAAQSIRASLFLSLAKNVLGRIGKRAAKTSLDEIIKHVTNLIIGLFS